MSSEFRMRAMRRGPMSWGVGIWMIQNHDNSNWGVERHYWFMPNPEDSYRRNVGAEAPDCSIEDGLAYVESIREQYGR